MSTNLAEAAPANLGAPEVIYFFGDSITHGWGDEDIGGWPARLTRHLQERAFAVTGYNLGVRGDTSTKIAERWADELQRRRRSGNALAVFAFGVNDATIEPDGRRPLPIEKTAGNVRRIIDEAQDLPILLIGPAPIDEPLMHQALNAKGSVPMPSPDTIAELSQCMAAVATESGVPFLDLYNTLLYNEGWQNSLRQVDGLHPSSSGHDLIARSILQWPVWRQYFPGA